MDEVYCKVWGSDGLSNKFKKKYTYSYTYKLIVFQMMCNLLINR